MSAVRARYRRAVREYLYLLITLPLAVVSFALVLAAIVSSVLSIVVIGIPVLVVVLAIARLLPRVVRFPARRLLGWTWPDPPPGRRTLRARLLDATAWRALAYAAARLPITLVGLYVPGAVIVGVVLVLIHGTAGWTVLAVAEVVVVVVALPWFVRLIVAVDRVLAHTLLGQPADAARVRTLEASRATLRTDAVAAGRRLERDLHDGTQARLVAIGMQLSRLETLTTEEPTRVLAAQTKQAVHDALAELRDIIRGIRPPSLDDGLDVALATLAARSPVPTTVDDRLARPIADPATATSLYFAASELLANVTRHAAASAATIELCEHHGAISLTVADDGRGGASTDTPGSGLDGIRQRIEALDGTLTINSPPGGPTRITATLPTPTSPPSAAEASQMSSTASPST